MPANVETLTELTVEDVQANHELLREMVQEDNPQIDVKRGPFDELVNYYGAVLATVNQENIDRVQRSQSLLEIAAEPTLADDDIVDGVLSNFLITRSDGSEASGSVTIVVSKLTSVTVSRGAVFTANGQEFTADEAYVAQTSSANIQSDSDRLLIELSDGNYGFNIDVTSSAVGAESRLSKNTAVVPAVAPVNFVEAYATSDFTGGTDAETNEELITRLQEGVAVKALSGRTTMSATLKAREGFEDILASSIIGMGDPEMLRDRHWIWPTSGGGRVDWYVQTQDRPQHLTVTKTATLVDTADGNGIWQITLDKDDAPGFYDVYSVVLEGESDFAGGYDVTEDTRGYDLTDEDFAPDINSAVEAAYTAFQTAVIQFQDTDTPVSELTVGSSEQDYDITVRVMPLIRDIQDAMADRDTRNVAGDLLVKAAVPCFVAISFTIEQKRTTTVDTDAIQSALADYVNGLGFAGRLYAGAISKVIQDLLPEGSNVGNIDIVGRVYRPEGTVKHLRGDDVLVIPDEAEDMVTSQTVVFVLEPADVGISTQTVG